MAQTSYGIKINGLDELVAAASKAGGDLPQKMLNAMAASVILIQTDAASVQAGRFKNQTGNLRRSIHKTVESANRGLVFVESTAPYGQSVEFGSKPHVIYPKRGKSLAFKTADGKMVFAKKVNHPGSKSYPYMRPAFENNLKPITEIYDHVALEIVKEMAS